MTTPTHYTLLLLLLASLLTTPATACTIVSAVAENGQVWNMNNEDGPRGVANYIIVFPKTEATRYGYYTLSYFSPEFGEGGGTQGGMNEAGLTYDFNAMRYVDDFDTESRAAYPAGNDAILAHIMADMRSVDEVVAFFETYWFAGGFRSAQLHVADRDGKFALISASGVVISEEGKPLVSTNFDICGKEDGSDCWRYPLATERLAEREVGLATMLSIALDARQKQHQTVYSNVQNLTTGDIWFMSYHDADKLVQVNIQDLLARGRASYSFSNLDALKGGDSATGEQSDVAPTDPSLTTEALVGTYHSDYIGNMVVTTGEDNLMVAFDNGTEDNFEVQPDGTYFNEAEGLTVTFHADEESGALSVDMYVDERWAVTAWREVE